MNVSLYSVQLIAGSQEEEEEDKGQEGDKESYPPVSLHWNTFQDKLTFCPPQADCN